MEHLDSPRTVQLSQKHQSLPLHSCFLWIDVNRFARMSLSVILSETQTWKLINLLTIDGNILREWTVNDQPLSLTVSRTVALIGVYHVFLPLLLPLQINFFRNRSRMNQQSTIARKDEKCRWLSSYKISTLLLGC